jgi:FixJ family two-component response regulator
MKPTRMPNPKVTKRHTSKIDARDGAIAPATPATAKEGVRANGHETAIFVLDDDPDILDSMAAVVHGLCKRPCVTAASVREMVNLSNQVLGSGLAFLDINLGADSPSGVEGYRWLRKHKYAGRVIFFTGHAQSHPQVQEAKRLGDADVVQKPVPLGSILKLIGS